MTNHAISILKELADLGKQLNNKELNRIFSRIGSIAYLRDVEVYDGPCKGLDLGSFLINNTDKVISTDTNIPDSGLTIFEINYRFDFELNHLSSRK